MYIPKNKIVPNLYTDGTKYVIEETNEKYEGYYYRLYNGDLYTGRNANVTPSFKLALIAATGSTSINQNINKAEIALPIDGFIRNEDYLEEAVIDYLVLKNTNFNDLPSIILPTPYYP